MSEPKPDRDRHEQQGKASGEPDGAGAFEIDPDETAALIDELSTERERLAEENKRLLMGAAELQNQVRTLRETGPKDVAEARRQVLASVARDVVQAIDTFDLALGHDPSTVSAESIIQGIGAIREALLKALKDHGILPFAPKPNDPFEPGRHEAVTMQPGENIEPGHIVATFQAGYLMHDRVLRPAKVSVAPS